VVVDCGAVVEGVEVVGGGVLGGADGGEVVEVPVGLVVGVFDPPGLGRGDSDAGGFR